MCEHGPVAPEASVVPHEAVTVWYEPVAITQAWNGYVFDDDCSVQCFAQLACADAGSGTAATPTVITNKSAAIRSGLRDRELVASMATSIVRGRSQLPLATPHPGLSDESLDPGYLPITE